METKQQIEEKYNWEFERDFISDILSALNEYASRMKAAEKLAEKIMDFELLNELGYDDMDEDLNEMKALARQILPEEDDV